MDHETGEHGLDPTWWEDRYRSQDAGTAHPPNPYLVEVAGGLDPGRALDAGCGEGAETLWLAERGWHVTALDVSQTALDRARERAEALGPEVAGRITWVRAELAAWSPPTGGLDLVCSHYAHPTGPAGRMVEQLGAAVAPGGTLLVVGHQHTGGHGHGGGRGDSDGHAHTDGHAHSDGHGPAAGTTFTPEVVTAALDPGGWDVLVAEHRTRRTGAPGAIRPGPGATLDDAVVVARRR